MTRDDLVSFRAALAPCEVTLLADVSAGTVLVCDSAVKLAQEYLDALCALACTIFAESRTLGCSAVFLANPLGTRVFIPLRLDQAEVLCCVFPPGADLSGIEAQVRVQFDAPEVSHG